MTAEDPIFLDLDGVLLDPSERYYRLYRDLVLKGGGRAVGKADFWEGLRAGRPLEELLSKSSALAVEEDYRRKWPELLEAPDYVRFDALLPGAREALAALHGHPLVLVTMRRRRDILEGELRAHGLGPFAQVLAASSERGDPAEIKKRLMEASPVLQGAGGRAMIVGDTEPDIRAGKALGLVTVAVLTGLRSRERLERENPDFIVDDVTAVPGIVARALRPQSLPDGPQDPRPPGSTRAGGGN